VAIAVRHILAVSILTVCLAGPVLSGPAEDAQAAYDRGDFATAAALWQNLAKDGDANAQVWLRRLYVEGKGVPLDNAETARWIRLATAQGYPRATYSSSRKV